MTPTTPEATMTPSLHADGELHLDLSARTSPTEHPGRAEIGESVVVDGLSTNVLLAGDGAPVLLVHGSGPGVSAYASWRLTIPALADRRRVIAPDLPGFGSTERPAPPMVCDIDRWTAHLIALLDALGVEWAAVVGIDVGGAVALRLAGAHPDRVDRLVLTGSTGVPFPITPGLEAAWGYEPSREAMRRLMKLFTYAREPVDDELAAVRYRASIEPGVAESFAALFPAPRQRWVDEQVTSDDELASLRQPALIVHGREDRVIPMSNALRLFEAIPDARLHVFGRCGHWTQIEYAVEFNRLVADFLAG
jgi:pimeloyl-ACP methyl ester carboxylesterase